MRVTRTRLIVATSLSVVLGLTACSSRKSAFPLQQQDERWFCTPQGDEAWLCQESDNQFEQLAKKEPLRQLPSNQQDSGFDESVELDQESLDDESLGEEPLDEESKNTSFEDATIDKDMENLEEPAVVSDIENIETVTENTLSDKAQPDDSIEEKAVSETAMEPDISDTEFKQSDISPWVIQLAAYRQATSAESLVQQVEGSQRFNTRVKGKEYITVVLVGFDTRWQALERAEQLQQKHLQLSPWVRSGDDFERVIIR